MRFAVKVCLLSVAIACLIAFAQIPPVSTAESCVSQDASGHLIAVPCRPVASVHITSEVQLPPAPSPFDYNAQLAANKAQAAEMERFEMARRTNSYQIAWQNWQRNAPIRAALGLVADAEPQPPYVFHATFDESNWRLVAAEGPDRLERMTTPPEAPRPPPSASLPGAPWDGTPYRHIKPNDPSAPGVEADFEGARWIRVDVPHMFGGVYKLWKRK
jgi:hypothetical protein